jgi:hypothetical protein
MRLLKWAFGVRQEPLRRRGVVLQLTSCEDRLVPDGGGPPPPTGGDPPGQESEEQQTFTFDVQPGELVYAGRVGGQDQLFTVDEAGYQWLFSVAEDGQFTAVLLNYDGSYDPDTNPLAQSGFAPAPDMWSQVWNPDQGTWTTVAPGTVFPGVVRGFNDGVWNYVLLQAQLPAPPVNPPAPPAGGVTITVTPGGNIQIAAPPGTDVTITPAPGGGVNIQVNGPNGPRPGVQANQPPEQAPPPRPVVDKAILDELRRIWGDPFRYSERWILPGWMYNPDWPDR